MRGFQSIKAAMICSVPQALQVREINCLYLDANLLQPVQGGCGRRRFLLKDHDKGYRQ